jgi:hypothetical protein
MTKLSRRRLPASTAVFVTVLGPRAFGLPWQPSETQPPILCEFSKME